MRKLPAVLCMFVFAAVATAVAAPFTLQNFTIAGQRNPPGRVVPPGTLMDDLAWPYDLNLSLGQTSHESNLVDAWTDEVAVAKNGKTVEQIPIQFIFEPPIFAGADTGVIVALSERFGFQQHGETIWDYPVLIQLGFEGPGEHYLPPYPIFFDQAYWWWLDQGWCYGFGTPVSLSYPKAPVESTSLVTEPSLSSLLLFASFLGAAGILWRRLRLPARG